MKVKICGITNFEDAAFAAGLGVDALGFIFAESPRRIEPEKARDIIQNLPPFVTAVGVFVNEGLSRIREISAFCGLQMIQLHGDETPDMAEGLMPNVIKAFQLRDETDLVRIGPYRGKVKAVLFDAFSKDKRGGTGKTLDWTLAKKGKAFNIPVILSGGLSPQNISEAVRAVGPCAVDINSGVEISQGKKDHGLMKELMDRAKPFKEDSSP